LKEIVDGKTESVPKSAKTAELILIRKTQKISETDRKKKKAQRFFSNEETPKMKERVKHDEKEKTHELKSLEGVEINSRLQPIKDPPKTTTMEILATSKAAKEARAKLRQLKVRRGPANAEKKAKKRLEKG